MKFSCKKGEAEAISLKAKATAESIKRIAHALSQEQGGHDAASLSVAEKYVEAFGNLAKQGTTVVVPANTSDAAGMVTQMLSLYRGIQNPNKIG